MAVCFWTGSERQSDFDQPPFDSLFDLGEQTLAQFLAKFLIDPLRVARFEDVHGGLRRRD